MATPAGTPTSERCSWCGTDVERGDGFRAAEYPGERKAAFCRLEHVVPWAIQGAHWQAGTPDEPSSVAAVHGECVQCGAALDDVWVQLVRHRGERRIPDAFCSVGHLAEWAKAGGRWQV